MNASDKILRDEGLLNLKAKIITGAVIVLPIVAAAVSGPNPHNWL